MAVEKLEDSMEDFQIVQMIHNPRQKHWVILILEGEWFEFAKSHGLDDTHVDVIEDHHPNVKDGITIKVLASKTLMQKANLKTSWDKKFPFHSKFSNYYRVYG